MKKLIPLLLICFLVSGCATDYFVKQNQSIDKAELEGKITTKEALQLKNDLYRSAQQGESAAIVFPVREQ